MKSKTAKSQSLLQITTFLVVLITYSLGMQVQSQAQVSRARLIQQASRVRKKLKLNLDLNMGTLTSDSSSSNTPTKEDLFFPSSYKQEYGPRGFCNWLIVDRIMIGQYPGQTPERHGPKKDEVLAHLDKIVNTNTNMNENENSSNSNSNSDGNRNSNNRKSRAKIRLFVSLQSEVPDQDNHQLWDEYGGKVQLPVGNGRDDFPNYFTHYAPLVRHVLDNNDHGNGNGNGNDDDNGIISDASFLHSPILDLNTPNSTSLISILSLILQYLEDNEHSNEDGDGDAGESDKHKHEHNAVYIHCWGGRGRAGLIGSCLLALLFPELNAKQCLSWVQRGYDSRDGSGFMPMGLRRSPQTVLQRQFVGDFVNSIRMM